MSVVCSILPPYLLDRLAASDDPRVAGSASLTKETDRALRQQREVRAERARPERRGGIGHDLPGSDPSGGRGVVQPDLLDRARTGKSETLRPGTHRGAQPEPSVRPAVPPRVKANPRRAVHDAVQGNTLPGRLVRAEGDPQSADPSVNEAYDGLGWTWELLHDGYGRDSLDGKGLPLVASVHFGTHYDNAFWDGEQMVFGDGDGVYFNSFTDCVDVIGHELAHGLTQYTANLIYVGQSGALNESVSDVFGSLVKQRQRRQRADEADWLIGEGLFTAKVNGAALRSMKAPGTAYDDPELGKDLQPADMDGYVVLPHDDAHDNGGVHYNSGIPNRAFYLAAMAIGGYAWELPGQIWYDTLVNGRLPKDVDFAGFATATITAARRVQGSKAAKKSSAPGAKDLAGAVEAAWRQVKVLKTTPAH